MIKNSIGAAFNATPVLYLYCPTNLHTLSTAQNRQTNIGRAVTSVRACEACVVRTYGRYYYSKRVLRMSPLRRNSSCMAKARCRLCCVCATLLFSRYSRIIGL